MQSESDIVEQFKDLDVAEPIKTLMDTPATVPIAGPGLHTGSAYTAAKSLAELLGQKKQLGVIRVTNGMNYGGHISTIDYDYRYVMANHFGNDPNLTINTATKFFKGFRANLKVTYEVTSMFQQQGCLILNAINMPPALFNATSFQKTNIYNLAKLPRRFITLGHDGTYEATIPWESNMKFWPFINYSDELVYGRLSTSEDRAMNGYNSNGKLTLRVFSPLKVGLNATDWAQIRIYTQLTNIEFCVYAPTNGGL